MSDKTMITCEEVQNCIPDYSVGNLSENRMKDVDVHIKACQSCAYELKVLQSTLSLVEAVEAVEPPAGMWNAVYEQIKPPVNSRQSFGEWLRTFFIPQRRVLATGFAVLGLLAAFTFGHIHNQMDPAIADAGTTEYVQGHAIFASDDAFSNQEGLSSVTGAAMLNQESQVQ